MRRARRYPALIALAAFSTLCAAEPVRFDIDPTHTFPTFEISHLGFSKHRGRFNRTRGTVMLDLAEKRGEISVTIEASSIDTGHEALETVLRSKGFFDAEQFPELRFRSTQMTFDGERPIAVHGTLSMKGVDQAITLEIDHFHCGHRVFEPRRVCGANASGRLLRSAYGIDKYVNFGLGDEVLLVIQIEAMAELPPPAVN